jgi:cytochrome c551/c552
MQITSNKITSFKLKLNMKKLVILGLFGILLIACSSSSQKNETSANDAGTSNNASTKTTTSANPAYDPNRGEGKFTHVDISPSLDVSMADNGSKVYNTKCSSCHKLTDEKLVGPGWKGVTQRHTAEWIMNFVTNTDDMLTKDPKAQAMLEICLVRMPNQHLTDQEARDVYEFMRKNDGIK